MPEQLKNPSPPQVNPWRAVVREGLCDTPGLLWSFPGAAVPGPTLWRAVRGWVEFFRAQKLAPGDRVVLGGNPDFGWTAAFLAGLWLELTLVPISPRLEAEVVAELLDARLALGPGGHINWDANGEPHAMRAQRKTCSAAQPAARFLISTSGTGGSPRWIALSDANVGAVLASHLPVLGLTRTDRLLSTLPWSHAFGLVLEFLAALKTGASLVRSAAPADVNEHLRLARQWKLNWWCAVPAMVRHLAGESAGPGFLNALRGGVVGGAAITAELAAILTGTRLRVGYGQTEAAPGIMLGDPGDFVPDILGRPVGCEVRQSEEGEIEFCGPNACLGLWPPAEFPPQRPPGPGWVATGDFGHTVGGTYFFEGRRDDLIRLENGRSVSALALERKFRAASPTIGRVALWSPDTRRLAVAFTGAEPTSVLLAECLGPLASRAWVLPRVGESQWPLTVKGELDRPALRRQLTPV